MTRKSLLTATFASLGIALAVTATGGSPLTGKVIAEPISFLKWTSLVEQEVLSGATLQANIHTFVQVPGSIESISRDIFFGHRGLTVRYWGYCLPAVEPEDPDNLRQTNGFPGKIFLSEAEREWRKLRDERLNRVSPFNPPRDLRRQEPPQNVIRHQIDLFRGGMTCYVMSAEPLPVGPDFDGDTLNTQREKEELTSPDLADTDEDGLDDGVEVLLSDTHPLFRDTDGDGLIDGIEDSNHNGYNDIGETDPRNRDTDRDGLCDGYCREYQTKRYCSDNVGRECINIPYGQAMGEDRNFNGKLDVGESDPLAVDTDGNKIWDQEDFYRCLLEGGEDC